MPRPLRKCGRLGVRVTDLSRARSRARPPTSHRVRRRRDVGAHRRDPDRPERRIPARCGLLARRGGIELRAGARPDLLQPRQGTARSRRPVGLRDLIRTQKAAARWRRGCDSPAGASTISQRCAQALRGAGSPRDAGAPPCGSRCRCRCLRDCLRRHSRARHHRKSPGSRRSYAPRG